MFENILGQDEAVALLKQGVLSGDLPRALLFTGPRRSGKATAALELARALSCRKGSADWNCPCPSCESHRRLSAQDLALLGKRAFSEEIEAARNLVESENAQAREKIFFVRAVRKLVRRFDRFLWQGEESRLAKAQAQLLSIDELMAEFESSEGPDSAKPAGKIAAECVKLESLVPDPVPIWQTRALASWVRIAAQERRKLVLLENADTLQEGSRNSLLKILEEPPENVFFVLQAPSRGTVMRTILSRVRTVDFPERTKPWQAAVMDRIFRKQTDESVDDYLSSFSAYPAKDARGHADSFLRAIVTQASETRKIHPVYAKVFPPSPSSSDDIAKALKAAGAKDSPDRAFRQFTECVLDGISRLLKECGNDTRILACAEKWRTAVMEATTRQGVYNLQAGAVLEWLAYTMREAL